MTRVDRIIILSIVAVMFVVAIGGIALWAPGRDARAAGPGSRIVIDDPWCAQSEDSCFLDYNHRGQWIIRRQIP